MRPLNRRKSFLHLGKSFDLSFINMLVIVVVEVVVFICLILMEVVVVVVFIYILMIELTYLMLCNLFSVRRVRS